MIPRAAALAALALAFFVGASTAQAGAGAQFDAAVQQVLAEPYQPDYQPTGFDQAFPDQQVPNTAPAQDYTSGSIAGNPDFPGWPSTFRQVLFHSKDGAPLFGQLAMHPFSKHAGVVVAHGFNTNGYDSVVRWAALLYARGYNVLAADQRDFKYEYRATKPDGSSAGYGYPNWLQTFGWKEAEDVLAAGRYLKSQPGVSSVGVVGFSEGAQNVVLALAQDTRHVFSAGLTFSAPADQDTQIYSTATPDGCVPPSCTYPATSALIAVVVPPYSYSDPCDVLADAAALYKTTPAAILARESAFHAQNRVKVPLLNFYAQDDPLVQDFQARMMAAYNAGHRLQRTIELTKGAHAYYYDRWWQQRAILLYFKAMLRNAHEDATIGTDATVDQTPGGTPAKDQLVDLGTPTRAEANALLAPTIC